MTRHKFNEWFNSEFVVLFFYFCFVPLACVFLQHFYKGFVHVSWRHEAFLSSCEDTQTSQRDSGGGGGRQRDGMFFWGGDDGGKCLCLRARAATFPWLAGVAPAAGCCSSSDFTPCDVKTQKPSGPQEQKGLASWGETEWMTEKSFYKKREQEKEKSVNKEQPFF